MKKFFVPMLIGFTGLLCVGENPHRFLLVAAEGIDVASVERVKVWMESQLHYGVELVRRPMWEGETLEEQVEALGELPRDKVLVTVVLSERLAGESHAAILPEARIGVVNVPVLHSEEDEVRFRRLERQAMRVAGFSLGVPPQPMPFCALAPYRDLEELDRMGRGFSPPAMAMYRQRLVALGIPLSERAEQLLPDVRVRMPAVPPEVPPAAPPEEQP